MSQALYRKYRSKSLGEIVGQEHITSMLERAIAGDIVHHAYLLTGPHGVGKTSIARIIAHQINSLDYSDESNHLDIIEIDAASNNGVDDVRELREKVHIAPTSAKKKIYIIDEVHMLTRQAFNALLKTLEEPPEHVVFILATTEADKLPATILSRVQRFNFRTIGQDEIAAHLGSIAAQENITIDKDALALLALHGEGSFRDSIGLLDQLRHSVSAGETITAASVEQALGITAHDTISRIIKDRRSGDLSALAGRVQQLEATGASAGIVASQLIRQIQTDVAAHPVDLPVLDGLLDVARSSHPFVKLLTVLANNIVPTPALSHQKTAQKSSNSVTSLPSAPEDSRPAVEETKQASSSQRPSEPKAVAHNDEVPATESSEVSKSRTTKPSEPEVADDQDDAQPTEQIEMEADAETFDWAKLLTASKSEVGLASLLAKSGHQIENGRLVIYAGNKFNSGRLKSPKQLSELHKILASIGHGNLIVDIKEDKLPPSDSQAAAVAAIMGGGEEVEL